MDRFAKTILAASCILVMLCAGALAANFQPGSQRFDPDPGFAGGDIQNAVICPRGEYLAGFTGRVGDRLDRIGLRCAPFLASGELGKPHGTKGGGLGGSGGSKATKDCKSGLINAINFFSTADQRKVIGIRGACVDPASGAWQSFIYLGGNGEGDSGFSHKCFSGNAATGLAVHWGNDVNAIGLICDPLVIPAPVQPCPEGQFRLDDTCQVPKVLPGSTTGTGGGFIQMFPEATGLDKKPLKVTNGADGSAENGQGFRSGGVKQATGVVEVSAANDTTIYDSPEGSDLAYLSAGDPVTIIKCTPRNWCQISAPQAGWVWGDDLAR